MYISRIKQTSFSCILLLYFSQVKRFTKNVKKIESPLCRRRWCWKKNHARRDECRVKNGMKFNWGRKRDRYNILIIHRLAAWTRIALSTDQEGHSGTELWNPKFRRRAQACSCRDYLWLNWRWDIWTGAVPVLTSQLQTWPDTKPLASMEGSRGLNSLTTVTDGASNVIHGLLGLSAVCFFEYSGPVSRHFRSSTVQTDGKTSRYFWKIKKLRLWNPISSH